MPGAIGIVLAYKDILASDGNGFIVFVFYLIIRINCPISHLLCIPISSLVLRQGSH